MSRVRGPATPRESACDVAPLAVRPWGLPMAVCLVSMASAQCTVRPVELSAPTFACSRDDECTPGFACDGQRCRATESGYLSDFAGWADVVALGAVTTDISAVDTALGHTGAARFDRNLNPAAVVGFDPEHVKVSRSALDVDTSFNAGTGLPHSLAPGQKVSFATDGTSTLPAPLLAGVGYYVVDGGPTRIQLAQSEAQALRGEAIELTSSATGPFVLLAAASVQLAWDPFQLNRKVVPERYHVYRSTSADGPWNEATRLGASATTQFVDRDVVAAATYFYLVQPVIAGAEVSAPLVADSVVQVIVPPDNMVLVHRWVANREVCTNLLGATFPSGVDRAAHYACPYRWGLSADGGHAFGASVPLDQKTRWDLGYSFVIDRFEAGCHVSATPLAVGIDVPDGGAPGDVAVQKGLVEPVCFVNRGGRWAGRYNLAYAEADRARMVTNAPGYFGLIANHVDAFDACQRRHPPGLAAPLRLMRLPELTAARAWNGVFANPSPADIEALLGAVSHRRAGSCHVASDPTSGYGVLPGDPGAFSQTTTNVFAYLTGSWGTRRCLTRYGAQDQVGNWREFITERIRVPPGFPANSVEISARELDPDNLFVDGFRYDGVVGPGHGVMAGVMGAVRTDLVKSEGPVIPMFGLTAAGVDEALGARKLGPLGPGAGFTFNFLWLHPTAGGLAFPIHDSFDQSYAAQMVGMAGYGLYQGRFIKQLPYGNPSLNYDSGAVWKSGERAFESSGFRCVGQVGP